ncbi:MAG TPA: hypothetical protein VFC19_49250 [Candidatus Limnocylindrales bacterium]|nr:hypothetical protein [Candidatus Limnocylindrales bacterium]
MALRVEVDKRELDKLAHNFRQTARVHAAKELDKALLDAGNVVEREIRHSTDVYMPRGYEQVFKRALVITVKPLKATRRVTLSGRAFGRRGHDRQVEEMERGRLKHPFWGRWMHVAQAWQRIRPGWMSEPAKRATPAAVAQLHQAAEKISHHLTRGL